ncbi:hypothetical protein RUM43_002767 [Polyplax serrata]|uniref:Uncharacterized protein n=1 Tax=Polyplax serrata TaxID=468196 RepID=A0AAN8NVA7_POLSC
MDKTRKEEFVLCGPHLSTSVGNESIAEYLIPLMKKQPEDFVAQIDAISGESIKGLDFLKMSLRVAEGLLKFGVDAGDVVMMACPNSIRCQATAMGIIFSGAVLAPIDQNLKPLEIQHLMREFQPKYIICESVKANEMRSNVQGLKFSAKIIRLDSSESTPNFFAWPDITTDVDVDNYEPRKVKDSRRDLAVICCSSGSTGLPKGVPLSHYSVLNLDTLSLGTSMLFTSPLFWISGLILLILSCTFKQTRIVPKSSSPEDLLDAIKKYKPHFTLVSPSGILFLVESPKFNLADVSSFNCIFTGGSILGQSTVEKVKAVWPGINLIQGYGMTELCGPITSTTPGDDLKSVGKIVASTELKIVDPSTGETLGPNQTGECRVRAERMMRGYYNNPEATKNAFDEEGWFKTGDLAYYDESGNIYITGRLKEAIKYRNYHICPTEIESFLVGLPGIVDAAIVPIQKGSDYHLKAVVVKKPECLLTAEDIIEKVKVSFSDYKHLREGVAFVDALPRTDVGKLRRWVLQNTYGAN